MSGGNEKLTRGSLLARNTLFNLVGQVSPVIVALFSIPIIIKGIGTDRFGILALAWMVIGYYSLFDFGLGRALTKLIAEKLGEGEQEAIPGLFWTALSLLAILGVMATIIVIIGSPWLVYKILRIPDILKREALSSFYLIALSMPIAMSTSGLVGFLEARQRFELTNIVRIVKGVLNYAGPLLVAMFSHNLVLVVASIVLTKTLAWVVYLVLCLGVMPMLRSNISIKGSIITQLIRFGSWMTISNIINPLLNAVDRFLIGALVSISAVAYYTTPYEIVMKVAIIPGAFAGVLFPAFSTCYSKDRKQTAILFVRALKAIICALAPIVLLLVVFAREGIYMWLGNEFMRNSTVVLQLLALGIFANGIALIPFSMVQGAGRPDLTAKLHLIELPFYLSVLLVLVRFNGIEGAAMAWLARVGLDMVLLFWLSGRVISVTRTEKTEISIMIGISVLLFGIAPLWRNVMGKLAFSLLAIGMLMIIVWVFFLSAQERTALKSGARLFWAKIAERF